MKSKVAGKNYEILFNDEDRFAKKIDKKVTDNCLAKLLKSMETITYLMVNKRWVENNDLYYFLKEKVFQKAGIEIDEDGWIIALCEASKSIKEIQHVLATHNDDIRPRSDSETLEDLGYCKRKSESIRYPTWEKVWSYDGLTDIDEIIFKPDGPERRLRTIREYVNSYGIKTDERKKRKVKIGKKMMKAIQNTIVENHLMDFSPKEDNNSALPDE